MSFATYFNAFPASYWRRWSMLDIGGAAGRTDRQRPRRRLPLQGHRRANHGRRQRRSSSDDSNDARRGPSSRSVSTRSRTAAGSGSTSPPTPRSPCTAPAGTPRWPRPGRANIAVGIPTFNRPADCVNALAALTSDPLVDSVIGAVIVSDQGTSKAVRPSRLRRGGRAARQPADHSQPAQPRWLRRLQPGHVRGAEEHRLRADPVHGRRHPHRAGLDPAGAGAQPVRQDRRR